MDNALLKNAIFDANYSVTTEKDKSFSCINRNQIGAITGLMPGLVGPMHNILADIEIATMTAIRGKYTLTVNDYICGKSTIASKLRESAATDFLLYGDEEKYSSALNRIDSLFNFQKFLLEKPINIYADLNNLNSDWIILKNKYDVKYSDFSKLEIHEKDYSIKFSENQVDIIIVNPIGVITDVRNSITINLLKDVEQIAHDSQYLLFQGDFEIFEKAVKHAYRFMDFPESRTMLELFEFCKDMINTHRIYPTLISEFIDFKNQDSKSEYACIKNPDSFIFKLELPNGLSHSLFQSNYYRSRIETDCITVYMNSGLVTKVHETILSELNAYQTSPGRLALYSELLYNSLVRFFDELIQWRKDTENVDE